MENLIFVLQFLMGRRLYYVVRKRASFISSDYHDIGCEELCISVIVVIVCCIQKQCDVV
jgi:hypothetical protein